MSDAPTQLTGVWSSSLHANHADDRDAEITRLRAKVELLAAALEFYADLSHEGPWHLPGEDYGKRARAALSAYEENRK